jgi:hypothetical protein
MNESCMMRVRQNEWQQCLTTTCVYVTLAHSGGVVRDWIVMPSSSDKSVLLQYKPQIQRRCEEGDGDLCSVNRMGEVLNFAKIPCDAKAIFDNIQNNTWYDVISRT